LAGKNFSEMTYFVPGGL